MAKGRYEIPQCCKTYGFPLYFATCVPFGLIVAAATTPAINEPVPNQDQVQHDKEQEQAPKPSPNQSPDHLLVALASSGGAGRSGVLNVVILFAINFATQSLFDHPISNSALKP